VAARCFRARSVLIRDFVTASVPYRVHPDFLELPMIAYETESSIDPSLDDLARRVALMLAQQLGRGSERIHVAARGGRVVLSGRVGTYYRRQLALAGARRVAGVRSIVDQIEVLPGPA
jgi:BON domain-containing protein